MSLLAKVVLGRIWGRVYFCNDAPDRGDGRPFMMRPACSVCFPGPFLWGLPATVERLREVGA